ncbi:histidine phosphatase family protein [Clostridium sp. D2Q-11]|uniref:Histidine phosphatase family protein n=1 Tax=Anaeromonas frigoriresistens TaxID=2683708 RepID=A0A942UW04_9FIRM|nr:histidine phosphatase family protein [Anaeromonas frigoriresistens]
MTKLYLTRHGQTVWNSERRFQGQQGSPLTEKGIEGAKKLGDRLKNIEFGAIYASPLPRAYDTAEIIKGDRDIKIIKEERIKEMSFGDWEGVKAKVVQESDAEMFNNLWNNPIAYMSEKGETYQQVYDRVIPVIEEIKEKYEGNVLIVAHGIVLAIIMLYVKGRPLKDLWEDEVLPNTSLTIVDAKNDKFNIELYGDISHNDSMTR